MNAIVPLNQKLWARLKFLQTNRQTNRQTDGHDKNYIPQKLCLQGHKNAKMLTHEAHRMSHDEKQIAISRSPEFAQVT